MLQLNILPSRLLSRQKSFLKIYFTRLFRHFATVSEKRPDRPVTHPRDLAPIVFCGTNPDFGSYWRFTLKNPPGKLLHLKWVWPDLFSTGVLWFACWDSVKRWTHSDTSWVQEDSSNPFSSPDLSHVLDQGGSGPVSCWFIGGKKWDMDFWIPSPFASSGFHEGIPGPQSLHQLSQEFGGEHWGLHDLLRVQGRGHPRGQIHRHHVRRRPGESLRAPGGRRGPSEEGPDVSTRRRLGLRKWQWVLYVLTVAPCCQRIPTQILPCINTRLR